MVTVRDARVEDAERILEIYDYYVKNTAITFEYETPSLDEFRARMAGIMQRYPYLVVLMDGKILGYAYAGAYISRAACDWSCEMTVYIDRSARKLGLGRVIYEALEKALCEMGIVNLYAAVAYPSCKDEYLDSNSADFHRHLGYVTVGEFRKCGYKFGRWYDLIWMEKAIGRHETGMKAIVPYPELRDRRERVTRTIHNSPDICN